MDNKQRVTCLLVKYFSSLALISCTLTSQQLFAQLNVQASYALIKRIIPQRAASFVIEPLQSQHGNDAFEIESKNNKIILRGNNGVAVASALYYYLTEYAHCQVTWNGTNLHLPKQLPVVDQKICKQTPYQYLLSQLLHIQLQHELVELGSLAKGN